MELVYLWVESYKNIEKQGFNFSSKFTCKYDDVKKELTIKENDDYIENFFGANINVTAIVGKNGSGKSSVLELINDMSYENPLISPYFIDFLSLIQVTIYYDRVKNKLYVYKKNLIIAYGSDVEKPLLYPFKYYIFYLILSFNY